MVIERGTARIERRTARINGTTTVWAVVAAFFTLVTAALGLLSWSLNNDLGGLNAQVGKLNQQNDQLQAQLSEANAGLSDRLDQIERLKKEMTDLESKLPPSASAADETATVRSAGTVVLATNGDKIDLNSTLTNFKLKSSWVYEDTLSYDQGTLRTYELSTVTVAGVASYGTCSTANGLDEGTRNRSEFTRPDKRLCASEFRSIRVDRG